MATAVVASPFFIHRSILFPTLCKFGQRFVDTSLPYPPSATKFPLNLTNNVLIIVLYLHDTVPNCPRLYTFVISNFFPHFPDGGSMSKVILLVLLVAIGGFCICYFGDGIFDCQYGGKTATLMDQLNDLPPTAAGN